MLSLCEEIPLLFLPNTAFLAPRTVQRPELTAALVGAVTSGEPTWQKAAFAGLLCIALPLSRAAPDPLAGATASSFAPLVECLFVLPRLPSRALLKEPPWGPIAALFRRVVTPTLLTERICPAFVRGARRSARIQQEEGSRANEFRGVCHHSASGGDADLW